MASVTYNTSFLKAVITKPSDMIWSTGSSKYYR